MKDHCENEWLCHLCGRKLKTKRNLINHYFVHTGEKPFSCNDCGKVFTCKDKLKLHLKIHKGIRPHVCLICNKAFIQKGHLASHSKSHVSSSSIDWMSLMHNFPFPISFRLQKVSTSNVNNVLNNLQIEPDTSCT